MRERQERDEGVDVEGEPAGASSQNFLRAAKLRQRMQARRIAGDEFVVGRGASKDDGQESLFDAEADAAKQKLRQKVKDTERAISEGAECALLRALGAGRQSAREQSQEAVIEAVKEPLKEKLLHFAKGGLQNGKARGAGAAGKMMRDKLSNEGTALLGKAAGATAVVGTVKEVLDTVEESELADFTAKTWKGLIDEIHRNLPALFDGYLQTIDDMDGQRAVDAAADDSGAPWVTKEHVAEVLTRLFDEAELDASRGRGGPLKGRAVFDKVQKVLHGGGEE